MFSATKKYYWKWGKNQQRWDQQAYLIIVWLLLIWSVSKTFPFGSCKNRENSDLLKNKPKVISMYLDVFVSKQQICEGKHREKNWCIQQIKRKRKMKKGISIHHHRKSYFLPYLFISCMYIICKRIIWVYVRLKRIATNHKSEPYYIMD